VATCQEEIENLQTWATANNLRLDRDKTKEVVFSACHKQEPPSLPPRRPDIYRLASLRVLGVIVNNRLTAADHVATLLSSCSRMMYAMHVLRAHGLPDTSLHDVFRAVVVSRIEYAAPAWTGMCSAADRTHLDSLLRRSKRLCYCWIDQLEVSDVFSAADDNDGSLGQGCRVLQ